MRWISTSTRTYRAGPHKQNIENVGQKVSQYIDCSRLVYKVSPPAAQGERFRDRLPAGDDGAERAGHLPGLRREGEDVGAGAEEDEESVRGPAEGQSAEGLQDGGCPP